jgi:uroporphyrin-3 C-methyltransferase
LAAAQGVSTEARGRWLRAQAEYYLGVANAELTLRGNRNNAIAALELADQALLDAGSPAFSSVRERIAGELVALRGTRAPDLEGLSYSLGRLAERVPELPMRAPAAEGESGTPTGNDAEPGLGRLWQSLKNGLAGMVRIERRDTTAVYSLSRNQQVLVRRQLELELTLARVGLVQALPEPFAASLGNARTLLEEHFDSEQAAVEGAALSGHQRIVDAAP